MPPPPRSNSNKKAASPGPGPGHHETKLNQNLSIGFFRPEYSEVMDRLLNEYGYPQKDSEYVTPFLKWLYVRPELVFNDPPDKIINDYVAVIYERKSREPTFKENLYSFAYWLFRWSGHVELKGFEDEEEDYDEED